MMNSLMSNFDAVMIFFNLVPSAVSVLYKNSQPFLDGRYYGNAGQIQKMKIKVGKRFLKF